MLCCLSTYGEGYYLPLVYSAYELLASMYSFCNSDCHLCLKLLLNMCESIIIRAQTLTVLVHFYPTLSFKDHRGAVHSSPTFILQQLCQSIVLFWLWDWGKVSCWMLWPNGSLNLGHLYLWAKLDGTDLRTNASPFSVCMCVCVEGGRESNSGRWCWGRIGSVSQCWEKSASLIYISHSHAEKLLHLILGQT